MANRENEPLLVPTRQNLNYLENGFSTGGPDRSTFSNNRPTIGVRSSPMIVSIAIGVAVLLTVGFVTIYDPSGKSSELLDENLKQSLPTESFPDFNDIEIPQGKIRGFKKISREGREYYSYYKIPYAEPPIGKLRFKDPIAPRSGWSGLRAETETPQCIQREKHVDYIRALGNEDCLHAQIFAPALKNNTGEVPPLPVMVYIYGASFTGGNCSRYSAEYFMDEDVIVAMFNYREGPFGFIQHGEILGNMGFKDQVEMLKWTQKNIQYFGGDPNRVTIFGNSAGSFSVSYLMLSPMATGLFHRAIAQSGASVCACSAPGVINRNPLRTIEEMGKALDCDTSNSTQFLECMQTKNAADIAVVKTPQTQYALTIERRNDSQVFMPDEPYQVLKTNPNRVPAIIGITNSERAGDALDLLMNPDMVTDLNENFAGIGESLLFSDLNVEELLSVKKFYFGDKRIDNSTYLDLANLTSDRVWAHCSYVTAQMHSDFSPTYLYVMSKAADWSYAEDGRTWFPFKKLGLVAHGDELQFQFPYQDVPIINKDNSEYFGFSKLFIKLWVDFAANGTLHPDWLPVSRSSKPTFWFDLNDKPKQTLSMEERMQFWDQFTHKQLKFDN